MYLTRGTIYVEIAKKLLEKNIDIEIIIETTGITKEELETLKNG